MAKFLNKKEQVIDFQLTPYGRQRLSVGSLKPAYYAFFDDGILYDSEYAGISENQNKIHNRIKESQYLEGLTRFEEIETSEPPPTLLEITAKEAAIHAGDIDISPPKKLANVNKYAFGSAIGSALFDGKNIQAAPAWKVVACQGNIAKSSVIDTSNYDFTKAEFDQEASEFNIPQIDITSTYTIEASPPTSYIDRDTVSDIVSETAAFADGNVIKLVRNDVVLYVEEQNTELLTENFDIEVFEIQDVGVADGSTEGVRTLERKYFEKEVKQIVNDLMVLPNPMSNKENLKLSTDAVEYFFDILKDSEIDAKIGCNCASTFNRGSYYIDLDYECDTKASIDEIYYDIYGSVTVPELCDPYLSADNTDPESCEDDEE
tara:strand:+ start:44991 stop:46115 length:1125 start_codon:yes stop_codon:yes gene_type:complete